MIEKFPEGAIKTREEVEELSDSGKAIYQVLIHEPDLKASNVQNMVPFHIVSYIAGRHADVCRISYESRDGTPTKTIYSDISLAWRNIGTSPFTKKGREGFLFTNYFHALAYDLQMKKKLAKKP